MAASYVVANCQYGIGNRLKCLISAMRIAEESSAKLMLYWPRDRYVNCDFCDLFAASIPEIEAEEFARLRELPPGSGCRVVTTWHLQVLPEDRLPHRFTRARPSLTGRDIDLEYERIPQNVRESLLRHIHQLTPAPEVAAKIEAYTREVGPLAAGISVRSWAEDRKRTALFDIDSVYRIIDDLGDKSFFLSCDTQECADEIVARCGGRARTFPRSTPAGDRCSRLGMQEIMVDLLLLGRCKRLWVPYMSTFPEMAWWFGGCQAQVSVIPPRQYLFRRLALSRDFTAYCIAGQWHLVFSAVFGLRMVKRAAQRLLGRA